MNLQPDARNGDNGTRRRRGKKGSRLEGERGRRRMLDLKEGTRGCVVMYESWWWWEVKESVEVEMEQK